MENQKEVWKSIKGYEELYEFSNFNNVKSLKFGKERILKQTLSDGYYKVRLWLNGNGITFRIHQLVAMEHLGHIPGGRELVIDHKNQIRNDNRIENLRIVTSRVNSNQKHLKSSSQYTGVTWFKHANKWRSQIKINGKQICLGYFNKEEEASQCYENALKNYSLGIEIEVKKPNFTSKYKGVCFDKRKRKWIAQIKINGSKKHIGTFNTELEAHNAYLQYINKKL